MRWLGPLLLIGVFVRHDTSQWLPWYSPPEWFYLLGGLWESLLCTILLLFVRLPIATAALWIGILESSQVTVCGAVMGHKRAPVGVNDCDFLAGIPLGATMTGLYVIIVCSAIGAAWRDYFGAGHELALGFTIMVIVTIAAQEIAHLVHPLAALAVICFACIGAGVAYTRTGS